MNLSVGIDARLDEVKLEIDGVEAEVHLVARFRNVRAILVKTLKTVGEHPEILRILARSLSQVVRESLGQTLATLDSALEGLEVGDTVDEALLGGLGEVRSALEGILDRSDGAVDGRLRRRWARARQASRRRLAKARTPPHSSRASGGSPPGFWFPSDRIVVRIPGVLR